MKRIIDVKAVAKTELVKALVVVIALDAAEAAEEELYLINTEVKGMSLYKEASLVNAGYYSGEWTKKYMKKIYGCKAAHNYGKSSRIHKVCKPVKVKAPHKQTVNHIY